MLGALFAAAGLLLTLVLGPTGVAGAGLVQPSVVGGSHIRIGEAPWQVEVEEIVSAAGKEVKFVCGGSILSSTTVLTAAHCVFNASKPVSAQDLHVAAGTSDFKLPEVEETEQLRDVSTFRFHPGYVPNPGAKEDIPDDVAVLTLKEPLDLALGVQPIALAAVGTILPEGALVKIAGFGQENPITEELTGALNSITMNVVSSRDCGGEANALFVCARTAKGSVCFGDSGSGLTIAGSPATPMAKATPVTLLGVTDTVEEKCAVNALAGFANVAAPEIRDFIEGSTSPPQAPRGDNPVLAGPPEVGRTLTCDAGSWSGSPTFTYAFINSANGQILQTGSSATYPLSSSDLGRAILCEVRATNAGGTGIVRSRVMLAIRAATGPPAIGSTTSGSGGGGNSTAPPAGGSTNPPIDGAGAGTVTLGGTTITVEGNGKASIKVVCRGSASCHGKLTLTAKSSVQVKGRQIVRTVPIGSASFAIPAGGSRTVQIKLGPVGRGLLGSGHGRLSARLAIVKLEPAPRQSQVKVVQLVAQKGPRRAK
jgi:Trypsin